MLCASNRGLRGDEVLECMHAGIWTAERLDCAKALHFCESWAVMIEITGKHENACAPQVQRTCNAGSDWAVGPGDNGEGRVAPKALDCSDAVGETLRYIASATFCMLNMLVEKSRLYTMRDERLCDWPEVTKCQPGTRVLPLMFFKGHFKGGRGTESKTSASSDYSGNES